MAKRNKKTSDSSPAAAPGDPGVASEKANAKLVHTDDLRDQSTVGTPAAAGNEVEEGRSVTTRDDANDLGVPMLPGSPDEPVGPEDALGTGPKRGDYSNRIGGDGYHPHEGSEPQRPRVADIGDDEGRKGGVETA